MNIIIIYTNNSIVIIFRAPKACTILLPIGYHASANRKLISTARSVPPVGRHFFAHYINTQSGKLCSAL